MGKFKFPKSFVETEYYCSSGMEHLRGKMDPADAKAIVKGTREFTPDMAIGEFIPLNEVIHSPKYVLRKSDADRTALMHINIKTGEFEGSVTFYGSSVRRPAEKPLGS